MIKVHQFIRDTLANQDIPAFYFKRQHGVYPCIVFNYNEQPLSRGDNKEELNLYDCYFNIICKGNITENVNKVKQVLDDAFFQKVVINAPVIFDGDDFYQITMNYVRHFEK